MCTYVRLTQKTKTIYGICVYNLCESSLNKGVGYYLLIVLILAIYNKIDIYLIMAGYIEMTNRWALDKSMSSLSTCHLNRLVLWTAIMFNSRTFIQTNQFHKHVIYKQTQLISEKFERSKLK